MRGDHDAARRLQAGGAKMPSGIDPEPVTQGLAALAASTTKPVPMIMVPDVGKALNWYLSIGFRAGPLRRRWCAELCDGLVGRAEIMLSMHGNPGPRDVSLWFYTTRSMSYIACSRAGSSTQRQPARGRALKSSNR